jgi:hypothetical protein
MKPNYGTDELDNQVRIGMVLGDWIPVISANQQGSFKEK